MMHSAGYLDEESMRWLVMSMSPIDLCGSISLFLSCCRSISLSSRNVLSSLIVCQRSNVSLSLTYIFQGKNRTVLGSDWVSGYHSIVFLLSLCYSNCVTPLCLVHHIKTITGVLALYPQHCVRSLNVTKIFACKLHLMASLSACCFQHRK